ncbi:MAG TPA: dihydrofolate reductase family protein [Polyangiaceae bacterium]|jgi:dihydrofolate reductase|nr:dihydrofolate reductase family protein [Polyangiaceae bacterium]
MRKIILYINSTLNGVVTGDPNKDKDNFMVWTTGPYIKAGTECLLETMATVDTLLLGRNTYKALSVPEGWPSVKKWGPSISDLTVALGDKINNAHKMVVTGGHPLDELKWGDYEAPKQLTGNNVEEQIKDLKESAGRDIVIFGSPTLVRALADANLIDEYQLQIAPVVVNVGEHLFDRLKERKDFALLGAKPLEGGSVLVKYKPVGG